jgi:iron(III) transport system substrate-binding protein
MLIRLFLTLLLLSPVSYSYSKTLKVYSERQPQLIEPLLKEFEEQTGMKVEWIYSQKGLVQKIILERNNPVADIFLSSDISHLIDIADAGAAIKLTPKSNIPDYLQTDMWVGLTQRARIFYVSKDLEIKNLDYEDLVRPEFKGRICTRSGFHPYNVSLFASLLEHHDEQWLEDYLIQLRSNLARKPQGNDRDQVKAIYGGVCDLSLGNHYYYFQMLNDENQKVWLDKASILFPNQTNRGAHVNISGIALLNEETKSEAEILLDYLISEEAQTIYANENDEFPVSINIKPSQRVQDISNNIIFDQLDLQKIADNRKTVLGILNKINFDQ